VINPSIGVERASTPGTPQEVSGRKHPDPYQACRAYANRQKNEANRAAKAAKEAKESLSGSTQTAIQKSSRKKYLTSSELLTHDTGSGNGPNNGQPGFSQQFKSQRQDKQIESTQPRESHAFSR
jgi:hypothetical protein